MYQLANELGPARAKARAKPKPLQVLAVPFGWGAGDPRTALAPAALAKAGLAARLRESAGSVKWRTLGCEEWAGSASPDARFGHVVSVASETAAGVERAIAAGSPFLVLGGDHSISAGTWAGAARAMRKRGRIGLIWIDAHMDAHVPETTPSGNWHGMPLAHLLGHGRPELTRLAGDLPAVRPENLCLVGARSFESGEAALLDRLGVRVIDMREIRRRGLAAELREAVRVATDGTAGFGVSWDIDSVDPADAPGVGTPVAAGIDGNDLLKALPELASHSGCLGLDTVEYNPVLDREGRTRALLSAVLARCYSRMASERSRLMELLLS